MNLKFTEITPSEELRPYVQTYWSGDFNIYNEAGFTQSVLPNGCIELIVHLDDDHCFLFKEKSWQSSPMLMLLGMFEKPYEVRFEKNVRVFGIRFYPDGIRNLFSMSPSEFLSAYEDVSSVAGVLLTEFCMKVKEAKTTAERALLTDVFLKQSLNKYSIANDYTHIAMNMIRQKRGIVNYESILQEIPVGVRQLQREFKNVYGISMRNYIRISRMNAIHKYLQANNESLTALSYEMDFADQSHFIKEFRNYNGIAPRNFIKAKGKYIINPATV